MNYISQQFNLNTQACTMRGFSRQSRVRPIDKLDIMLLFLTLWPIAKHSHSSAV